MLSAPRIPSIRILKNLSDSSLNIPSIQADSSGSSPSDASRRTAPAYRADVAYPAADSLRFITPHTEYSDRFVLFVVNCQKPSGAAVPRIPRSRSRSDASSNLPKYTEYAGRVIPSESFRSRCEVRPSYTPTKRHTPQPLRSDSSPRILSIRGERSTPEYSEEITHTPQVRPRHRIPSTLDPNTISGAATLRGVSTVNTIYRIEGLRDRHTVYIIEDLQRMRGGRGRRWLQLLRWMRGMRGIQANPLCARNTYPMVLATRKRRRRSKRKKKEAIYQISTFLCYLPLYLPLGSKVYKIVRASNRILFVYILLLTLLNLLNLKIDYTK